MSEQQREEREVVLQFQPKHERRPHSAPHHHVKRMGTDEERIKIRMALRALDELVEPSLDLSARLGQIIQIGTGSQLTGQEVQTPSNHLEAH